MSAEAAQAHAAAAGVSGAAVASAMTMTRQPFPSDPGQARLPVAHVSVQSVHSGRSDVTILHVQDAHSNLSGQKNLAAALDELMTRYPVELVLVEGGSGDVTLDRLKAVGTREQWSRAAGRLLYEGLIAGEEYLNLTSDHTMRLEGIEEKALYRQSLKVYDTIVRHRKETLPYLRRIALALERVKNRVYPQALLDYETELRGASLTGAGAQGEPAAADFSARTEKLLELARTVGTDLSGFAAVRELILLKTAEKRVHFERAQAEEEALLTAAYPDRGSDAFRSYVEARRKARVSPAAQLALMNDLLERSGRPRESLVMLGAYLKYLEDLSKIDMNALLLEMDLLEDAVYRDALKDSEDARMLRACDRFLGLLQKAYRIRMSSDEFRTLKVNESDLPTPLVLGFLNRQLLDLGYVEDLTPYETPLEEARYAIELFYRLVDKRDRAFIANAKSAIAARGARTAVLITGGYHTAHLEKLMRAEDWSYAVLTPMVEYETDQDRYESLLLPPLKTARRKLAAAAGRSVNVEAEEAIRTARGPLKVRDGLRAQAAAARLSAADPASARVIESVFGTESRQVLLTAGARMTASPAAAAAARVRPQANGYRRAFIKVQNWFYRNASLALTSSLLSLTTSYLFPRALWWMTMGFLVLSLTASVHLAKRLRYARHAEIMSGVNVVFQSLLVAAVLYAGTGWKAGIDRAAERTRQLFKRDPIAETGGALTVGAVPLVGPGTVPGTAPAPSIAPKVVDAAPAPSVPEMVLERARQASDLVLPDHVAAFNRAFVPLISEVMISETALTGYTPGAETDPERRAEFGRHVLEMAAVMSAVSRIETGKGYGGPEGTGMLEKGGAARASGVWQMNGATAKWVIANLIAQPDVYLKPFIDGSSDPEGMRAGILRLREAYREPLFDMFGVDLALGEDGWKRVVEAVKALTDDQMKRLMAEPDVSKPRLDTSDRYRVQFVTARILMLFKGVRDAKTYMEFYNTSVQADPAFKGLTSWVKAETFFSHARFVLEAAFEAYGSGAELDTARLSALESKLALLEQAMDGVGETLYQMTRLLKLSVQEPGSDQAPELIKSIRDNVFKFRVQFGSLSELGFGALMERFVESVQKDLSIIETRLRPAEANKAGAGGARMARQYEVLSRNALYAPGDAVRVGLYRDRVEFLTELFEANRPMYLRERAAIVRQVERTFSVARGEHPSDHGRVSRLVDRSLRKLKEVFLNSVPDEAGQVRDREFVSAEDILAEEMSGWDDVTPRELVEASRLLHQIMSGLDQLYFYADTWFDVQLVRAVPVSESRWVRRMKRAAERLRTLYQRLVPPSSPDRQSVYRNLQLAVRDLKLAAEGDEAFKKALRASGLLALLGENAAAARRGMTVPGYPAALKALLENAEPDDIQSREVGRVLEALEGLRVLRMTTDRTAMRQLDPNDGHQSEVARIQQFVDSLEYIAPHSDRHPGKLEYKSPEGIVADLTHLGSGVFNDVFDWNADYIVRVTRFQDRAEQFEDPELIRGAVAGVDGTGLIPHVVFFGQLRDGRSVQIIERMTETLDKHLTAASRYNTQAEARAVVKALDRFAVRAVESGYALEDAHTGNFMLTERFGRIEVVYSDIDGLQKIGTSPGSQFQVALHFRGQLLGYPSFNPWAHQARTLGRPLLRRLNLMIGGYQADRLAERVVNQADLAGIRGEQREELEALQEAMGPVPSRSVRAYDWENSFTRYMPGLPGDPGKPAPVTSEQIQEAYLETVKRVNGFFQKWPRTEETRWIADLLLLRAQWTRAMRMAHYQYENRWAKTSLDRMIEAYEGRQDIRPSSWWEPFLSIGWRRWTAAAAADLAMGAVTWLALGGSEGVYRLVQEHPFLAAAAGVSTVLGMTGVVMLVLQPGLKRRYTVSGARMGMADLEAHFKALTGLDHDRMYRGADLYPGPHAHQIEQSLNFASQAVEWLEEARLSQRLPEDREIRIADWGTGNGVLSMAVAKWARDRQVRVRISAVDIDARAVIAASRNMELADPEASGITDFRTVLLPRDADDRSTEVPGDYDFIFVNAPDVAGPAALVGSKDTVVTGRDNFDRMMRSSAASLGHAGSVFIESNLRPDPGMFGENASMRVLPLDPMDAHKRKVWIVTRSRVLDLSQRIMDPKNVKSTFAAHEEDPVKVWSWMTEMGRRVYLKWLPADPDQVGETALGPDAGYLDDAMTMLQREGELLRKISLEPRYENVRGYFSVLADQGRISSEEAASLRGDGTDGILVPEGAAFVLTAEIPGVPLSEWIKKAGRSKEEIEALMAVLASSVRAIHEAGIFHGDLGPSEVFIEETEDGRTLVRFADLGLSVLRGDVQLGLTDMMARPGLLTLANEGFNADAAKWVLALRQRDPWRARDLASLTNLYLFMIGRIGLDASKLETAAWVRDLLDPERTGAYTAAFSDYLRAIEAGAQEAEQGARLAGPDQGEEVPSDRSSGARMASGGKGAWFFTLMKLLVPAAVFAVTYLALSRLAENKMETLRSGSSLTEPAAAAPDTGPGTEQGPMITEIPEAEMNPDEAERLLEALEKRTARGAEGILAASGEIQSRTYFIRLLVDAVTDWQDRVQSLSAAPEWAPALDERIDRAVGRAKVVLAEVDKELASLTVQDPDTSEPVPVAPLNAWEKLVQDMEVLRVTHPKGTRAVAATPQVWEKLLSGREQMKAMVETAYAYENDDRSLFNNVNAEDMEVSLRDLEGYMSLTAVEYAQLVLDTQKHAKGHPAYKSGADGRFEVDERLNMNIRLWMSGAFRNAGDPVFYEVLRWSGLRKMERDVAPALWAVIRHLVAEDGTVRTPIVDLWPEGASPLTVYRSADKSAAALLPDVKHILHAEVHLDYEKFTNADEAGTLTEKDGTIRKSGSYGSDNPVGGRPNLAFYKRGNYWELMTSDAALVLKPADLVHLKREYPRLIREWVEAMAKHRGWDPEEVGVAAALRIHTLYSEGDGVEDGDRAGAIAVRDANRTADLVANFKGGETVRTLLTRADVYGAGPSSEFAELFSRKKMDSKALDGTVARLAGELERLKKERAPSDPEFILADKVFRAVRGYQSAYEFASAYLKFVGEDKAVLDKRSHAMALTYLMTVIAETNLDPSIYGNPRSPGPAQTGYGSWKDALASARTTLAQDGERSEFQAGLIAENPDRVRLEKMHEFLLEGWSAGKAKTGPAAKLREFVRLAAEGEDHSDAFNALLSGDSDGPAGAERVSPAVFYTIMMQKSMGDLSWTEYPLTAYHADFNTSTWQSWEAAAAAIGRTPAGLEADLKGIRVLDGGAVGPRTEAALVGAMEIVMDAVLNGSDLGSLADAMDRTIEKMDSNGGLVRFFHNGAGKRILKAIAGPDASRKISFADWKEFLEVKKEVEARVGQDAGAYHWVARSMQVVAGYLESRSLVYSDKRPSEVASVKVPDGARMAANSPRKGFDANARYLVAIHQELEKAGHRTELTVYPAAGADVVSALIATDALEIVMIDRAPLGGPEDPVSEHDRREYVQSKSVMGWSPGYLIQNGVLAMIRLELEVFAGIEWADVSYERVSGDEARLTFAWRHPAQAEPVMRTVRLLTAAAGAERGLGDWSARIDGLRPAGPKTVFLKAGEYQSVLQREADGASGEVPPGITDESALVQDILEVMGPGRQAVIADVPIRLNGSFRRIADSALVDALSSGSASFGYGTPGYSKRILPPQAFVYAGGTAEPASGWSLPSIIREQIAGRPAPALPTATNITQSLRHPEMLLAIHEYAKASGPLDVMVIGPGSRTGRSPMMEEVLLMLRHGERNRYIVIDPDPGVLEAAVRPQFRQADYESWFSVREKTLSDDDGFIRSVARRNLSELQASKDRLQIEGFQADPAEIGDFGSDELDLVIAPFALGYALRSVIDRAGGERGRAEVARWLTSLVGSLRTGGRIIVTPTDLGVLTNSDLADALESVQRDLAAAGRELALETDDPELIILSVGELSAGARMSWAQAKDDPRVLATEPFYFADHRFVSPAEGKGVYDGIWRRVFGSQEHAQEVIAVRTLDNGDIRIARPAEGQKVSHADLGKALTGAEESGSEPDTRTAYILLDRLNGEPVAAVQHATEVTARFSSSGAAVDEWAVGMMSLSMAVHVVEKLAAADGQDPSDLRMETTLLSFLGGAPVSQRGLTDLSRIQKILFTAVQAYRHASGGLSAGTMRSMVPDRAEQDIIWAAGYGLARAAGAGAGTFRSELDRPEDPAFHESSGYARALDAARFFLAKERILEALGSFEAAGKEAGAAAVKKQLNKLLGADLRKLASGNYMDEEYAFRAALAVRNADALGLVGLEEPVGSALRSIDRVLEGRSDGRLERLFDDYRAIPDISERQRPHAEIAVHDFRPDIQTWHQRPQLALTDFGLRLRALGVKAWIRDDFEGRQVFHDGGNGARVDRLRDVSRLRLSKGFDARLKIKTVERNLPGMTSAQVMDVVRQLMIGTEPVEHPVLGALPAGFLTSGREISAVNLPDDRDARQLVLMDWAPYFTVIDRIRALPAAEPAPAAARLSDAGIATTVPADVSVIRFRDFYGVARLLASEGGAWAAEPMPVRAADPVRSAADRGAAARQAAGTEAPWTALAAERVVAAFQSLRLNGRDPSFVTVLSSGARSAEYRARAEKTASMLGSVLGLGPEAFPVITAAEASDPRYASQRKVHLALDREMDEDAVLAASVIGRGLNIVSDQDPDSVSMAMVLQTLMADVSGEEQDARKLRLLAERHGKFLRGIFGRLPSEADLVRALSGMFKVEDADQVRMVRSLPVMGKTLGARLAEALLAVIETGRSA